MAPYRRINFYSCLMVMITLSALAGCSFQAITPVGSTSTLAVPSPESTPRVEIPTLPPPTQPEPTETPLVMSYRSILLLERAADLIIEYLGDVQAGSINGSDTAASQPYTIAFPIAIKAYNQSIPPSELGMSWRNVTTIAVEYNKVYSLIQQGKPVAMADYYNLKAFRQILSSEQGRIEVSLTNAGMDQDFFNAEQQSVDQLLQQEYGDIPVPTISP